MVRTHVHTASCGQHVTREVQGSLRPRRGHHAAEVRVGSEEGLPADDDEVAAGPRKSHVQPPGTAREAVAAIARRCSGGAAAAEDGDLALAALESVDGRSLHAPQARGDERLGASIGLAAVEADDAQVLRPHLATAQRPAQPTRTEARLVVVPVGLAYPHLGALAEDDRERRRPRTQGRAALLRRHAAAQPSPVEKGAPQLSDRRVAPELRRQLRPERLRRLLPEPLQQ
mmetsp:Transcript_78134/g.242240  ORF Transcript_78134/g.242240 Transcript_78134/m.242240 type:complete len:229 (+) Transcript_78134:132-818(+)